MRIRYKKQATKVLAKMPQKVAGLIEEKLLAIMRGDMPPNLDIKPIQDAEGGYRLRQGDWRILYHFEDDELVVSRIKPRGDAYK